jgi:hypothetical protein
MYYGESVTDFSQGFWISDPTIWIIVNLTVTMVTHEAFVMWLAVTLEASTSKQLHLSYLRKDEQIGT